MENHSSTKVNHPFCIYNIYIYIYIIIYILYIIYYIIYIHYYRYIHISYIVLSISMGFSVVYSRFLWFSMGHRCGWSPSPWCLLSFAAAAIGLGTFRQFHPLDAFLKKDLRVVKKRGGVKPGDLSTTWKRIGIMGIERGLNGTFVGIYKWFEEAFNNKWSFFRPTF